MSMERLLREIATIPGVIGSCVYNRNRGVLYRDLDTTLTADMLEEVGMHVVRLVQMGRMCGITVRSGHFRFDRFTLIGISLGSETVLMIVCGLQSNCSLIATTAGMLVADMHEAIAGPGATQAGALQGADSDGLDVEMEEFYHDIEQALAAAIGPVATVVMQDYLEKWRANGPVIPARLSELAAMLAEEIGDEERIAEFRSRIQDIL